MRFLLIVNDPPYGTERVYNALRLARALLKKIPQMEVTVFLMADSVVAAKVGQKTPDGYYNVEHILKWVLAGLGKVLVRCLHGCAASTMPFSWRARATAPWMRSPQ
jgi:uncharacterized protein involved in oxidation of intracellular sulfur